MQDKLPTLLTGFKKIIVHSTVLCTYLKIGKKGLDKGRYVCAMFRDLSEAYFDTIHHNLMIAKLGGYDFSQDALQHMRSYLTRRQQRVRVNSNVSTWENIVAGVSQDSILRPFYLTSSSMIFLFLFQIHS